MHGGTCENTAPDKYRCTCAKGLSGERCEIVEEPCAPQPCRNGGTCVANVSMDLMTQVTVTQVVLISRRR